MKINLKPYIKSLGIPPEINTLIHQANWDLYHGVPDNPYYPGFDTSVSKIRDALDDLGDVYIDLDTDDFTESEEEAQEMITPRFVERREVLRTILGTELAEYI